MFWNRPWLLFAALFLAFNLLVFNHSISLWDEDEAAYAGFAQQMLETGDWANPQYEWSTIHRKTPFHFWAIAVSFSIFGCNEFALRLPSALAIWLTCAALWWWGRAVFGRDQAAWAAVILASTVVVPLYGKVSFTDATLLLFQTTAVLGLLNYLENPHWRWNLLLWSSVALGVLTKGPMVLILIGGLWFWLLLLHPQRRRLVGTHPWIFLPLALLPFGAWMYVSWQRDGGQLLTFLYEWYILKRVGGSVLGQSGPPGYHLVILLVSFLTWTPFVWTALADRLRHWRVWTAPQIALAGWMFFGWIFFEFMSSKLPSYALAAHPAWALAIASQLTQTESSFPRLFRAGIVFSATLWSLIFLAFAGFSYWLAGTAGLPVALGMFAVAGMAGFYFIKFLWQGHRFAGIYTAVFGMATLSALLVGVAWVVEPSPIKNIKPLVQQAQEWTGNQQPLSVYYSELHLKQRKISFLVYLDRAFEESRSLSPDSVAIFYNRPTPALFIIGDEATRAVDALALPQLPQDRWIRIDWRSTDDQLRVHPFYLVKNF